MINLKITLIVMLFSINLQGQKLLNITHYSIDLPLVILAYGLEDVMISVVYLPEKYNKGEYQFHGIVKQNKIDNYTIYVSKNLDIYQVLKMLSHEFVHVRQYVCGNLVKVGCNLKYKGIVYTPKTKYKKRIYEIEAFEQQKKVYEKLKARIKETDNYYANYLSLR